MGDSGIEDYRFSVTGYRGFESEILRLRNANRSLPQSAGYLDWRYAGTNGGPQPRLFWVKDGAGRSRGMAALIFRRFWVDSTPRHVAVLGDISLDAALRGRGLGRSLLKFMSEDLDRNHPDCIAFVIPNEAAQQSLASAGWTTSGRLIPFVYILDAEQRLRRVLGSLRLARAIARPAARLMAGIARAHRKRGYSLLCARELDNSFDALWQRTEKRRLVLSDRSVEALRWRYATHPTLDFEFASLHRHGQLAGYLVYSVVEEERECSVYDLVLPDESDVGCMLALFVTQLAGRGGIDTVRLLLNEDHPYGRHLWKLGFVARRPSGVFQLHGKSARALMGGCKWLLTLGDKDI